MLFPSTLAVCGKKSRVAAVLLTGIFPLNQFGNKTTNKPRTGIGRTGLGMTGQT